MYIESISIENLKSISKLRWDLNGSSPEGWHVILGDNGTGKTTFLRGVCIALLGPFQLNGSRESNDKMVLQGPREAESLVPDWASYIRNGAEAAQCILKLRRDSDIRLDPSSNDFMPPLASLTASVEIRRHDDGSAEAIDYARDFGIRTNFTGERLERKEGWFSAAYGPFRRFTGGDIDEENSLFTRPAVGRHMSVFKERVALSEPIRWIMSLYIEELKNRDQSLQDLKEFINQEGFLPNGVRFDRVTSKDVLFTDEGGATVRIEDLSDGYRSVLCMTLELIRQLCLSYKQVSIFERGEAITVAVPGVVLIDEIDVHLHPSWQRAIGLWFSKHFPKIQFIVTTHSPLVCQAAEHGSVYSLSGADSEQESHRVEGADLKRLLYGDILDAYSTELFGTDVDRSPEAQALTKRLAQLNIAELDRDLTESEKKEQKDLRRTLPTSAYTVSL